MNLFDGSSVVTRHWIAKPLRLRSRSCDGRPIVGACERFALGDQNLRPHDVDAGHFLGDGVLDLNPRIDLDEVELVRVGIDEKLDRAGVVVADGAADRDARRRRSVADVGRQIRRGGDLDHLLMSPLHRAVALPQMDQIAVAVAEELDLDVPGPRDELLDEDLVAAEGGERFAAGGFEGVGEILRLR